MAVFRIPRGAVIFNAAHGVTSIEVPVLAGHECEEIPSEWIERVQFFPGGRPLLKSDPGGVYCLTRKGFMANQEQIRDAFIAYTGPRVDWPLFQEKVMGHFRNRDKRLLEFHRDAAHRLKEICELVEEDLANVC